MPSRFPLLLVIALLLCALPARATTGIRPPPSLKTHSLEALVLQADVVVTAVVDGITERPPDRLITFTPKQILKAPPGWALPAHLYQHSYTTEPLPDPRPVPGANCILFGEGGSNRVYLALDVSPAALARHAPFDLNFDAIRDPTAILTLIRAEAARPAGRVWFADTTYQLGPAVLPADARTFPAARRWIRSPDPRARYLAPHILVSSQDPADIDLVRDLLADPYVEDEVHWVSPWSGHEYAIRQSAARALLARGEALPPVVLSEPRTDLYRAVPLSGLAFLLVPPAGFLLVRAYRRRCLPAAPLRRHVAALLHFTTLYLFLLVAFLAWRSTDTVDDFVLTHNGRLYSLTSLDGHVYFETARPFPGQTPLVHLAVTPVRQQTPISLRNGHGCDMIGRWDPSRHWSPINTRLIVAQPSNISTHPIEYRSKGNYHRVPGHVTQIGYVYFALPLLLWPLLCLAAFLARLIRRARADRRVRQGLCPTCAYDLRAHLAALVSFRCPECGTPFPSPAPTPNSQTLDSELQN